MHESTGAPESAADTFRGRVQEMLRDAILDSALRRASEVSWSQVRVSDIAEDVGVSRQTVHTEFGTKEQLVLALFQRELDGVLAGVDSLIQGADDFAAGLSDVVTWVLNDVAQRKVIARMIADAKQGSNQGMVSVLTVHVDALAVPIRARAVGAARARWPELDRESAEVAVELAIRFTIGQLVSPSDLPRDSLMHALLGVARAVQSDVA